MQDEASSSTEVEKKFNAYLRSSIFGGGKSSARIPLCDVHTDFPSDSTRWQQSETKKRSCTSKLEACRHSIAPIPAPRTQSISLLVEEDTSSFASLPLKARVERLAESLGHLRQAHNTMQNQVQQSLDRLRGEMTVSAGDIAEVMERASGQLRQNEREALETKSILEGHVSKMEMAIAQLGRYVEEIGGRQEEIEAIIRQVEREVYG